MAEEKQPEFVVTDRRRLTSEGELKEGVESSAKPSAPPSFASPPQASPAPPPPPRTAPTASPKEAARAEQAARKYAEAGAGFDQLSFEKVVMFLAQTAMLQLGLLTADPTRPPEPDLLGARETIDMLCVLQEKTRGNVTPQEQRLLDNSLYELRMAWMELSRRSAKAP